jgi:hypothetical protein
VTWKLALFWADDRYFILEEKDKYPWPKGDSLKILTKQHWDKILNPQYTCPSLENGDASSGCENVQPKSKNWVSWETESFFLFQDQAGAEEYQKFGSVVTLKATGQAKEITVMSGNMNEKVQMLQVCCPDVPVDLLVCFRTHIVLVPHAGTWCMCAPLRTGNARGCSAVLPTDRSRMVCPFAFTVIPSLWSSRLVILLTTWTI